MGETLKKSWLLFDKKEELDLRSTKSVNPTFLLIENPVIGS